MEKYTKKYEAFWQAYPRKTGKLAAFRKYKMALQYIPHKELLEAVEVYAKSVEGKDKQFIPHPATWLHQGRWDDEIEQVETIAERLARLENENT